MIVVYWIMGIAMGLTILGMFAPKKKEEETKDK